MRLYTLRGLAYPITVTALLQKVGDEIGQNAPLFTYKYTANNNEWDANKGENVDVEQTYYSNFESEVEGKITSLDVNVGQVLKSRTLVADIEEPCRHEVQFGGMCANCGKDMTVQQYNTTKLNTERATVNNVHGHTALLISREEASKADEEAKRRLLDARKLSLVVDLDQTIIHATVDPTVGEWQKDISNPNHEAVKEVRFFQLIDDGPGARGTWYYIKLRPGLKEFLETVSQHYELHIYTMATRAYAENISKIVDPDRKLFGERILSRDENGSMSSKSLKRLFPVDTKMVVIIDDRGDVWSWSPNLVKVSPYDFFVGIGDINSSFLPKRPELEARPSKPAKAEITEPVATSSGTEEVVLGDGEMPTNGDVSAVDRIVSMAGSQDEGSLKEKNEEQEQTIAAQLEDRPLLRKQQILDHAEEEAKISPAAKAATDLLSQRGEQLAAEDGAPRYRHNLLQDDDDELGNLGRSLRNIHEAFFNEYDKGTAGSKGGRVAELRPGHSKKRSIDELENIPDAAVIMTDLKQKVLSGVHLVFSGVIPIGVDVQTHDIATWAKSFGATVSESIGKNTTHLIASPERRTAKVRQAVKRGGRVAVVNQNWLYACFSQWQKVDEGPFRIHSDPAANGAAGLPESFEEKALLLSSSDEEAAQTEDETDGGGMATPNGTRGEPSLKISTDLVELQKYGPSLDRQDSSPTATERADDWNEMQDELDEFLGEGWEDEETDADSDVESGRSDTADGIQTPPSEKKRKRAPDENGDEDEDGSRLQKRRSKAISRVSSLTNVATANGQYNNTGPDADAGGDEDDDLEAALAAEMERQLEEDGTD